jgi:hypothetical protein
VAFLQSNNTLVCRRNHHLESERGLRRSCPHFICGAVGYRKERGHAPLCDFPGLDEPEVVSSASFLGLRKLNRAPFRITT